MNDRKKKPGLALWLPLILFGGFFALVIWGLEDRILTLDTPLTYAKLMPNCEVLMYPKTGHWVQWERAEDFNRSAIEFLTRA